MNTNKTGQRFGSFEVVRILPREEWKPDTGKWYECLCDCGLTEKRRGSNLWEKSCCKKCQYAKAMKACHEALTKYRPGMIVGQITILARAEGGRFKIRCKCGRVYERSGIDDGHACFPCHQKTRLHDLTGKKFGKWKVLRMLPTIPGKKDTRCEAKCGLCKKVYSVACRNLSAGLTRKCRPCSERISRKVATSRSEQAVAWRAACKP